MQTQKVTLTSVTRYTTDKNGQPLVSKNGKPYSSCRIKCKEYGGKILSGFGNSTTEKWVVGNVVDIEVEEKGQYLNFNIPKPENALLERIKALEDRVLALESNRGSQGSTEADPGLNGLDDSWAMDEEPPIE